MKLFNKALYLLAGAGLMTLTGCIEETFPESGTATSEQVGGSSTALMASVSGIPSQMAQGYLVYGDQVNETDMGYPQYMIMMTEMLGDMYPEGANSGYDWYRNYNTFSGTMGETTDYAYLPWFTGYKFIKSANDIISMVDMKTADKEKKALAGIAYACRAFDYYLLTVLYQPVKNHYTDCRSVLGLTVPKVTESTDRETAKNNPRLTTKEMKEFILSDLNTAEEALKGYTPDSKLYPDSTVIYGLKAKVYMWFEDYANAYEYAKKAIDAYTSNGSVDKFVTESQWEDPNTGFNTANQAWMWYIHYDAENMGNLCNFTGWMSGEADWGYSSLTCPAIDRSLYDHMGLYDFRRHTFLDPEKYSYYEYKTSRDKDFINDAPDYLALKFRCVGGDWENYAVGGACDVPIMRIEEMYFIKAEAAVMKEGGSLEEGKNILNSLIQTRDPEYVCPATSPREFQIENLAQMRIEFWGEGNAFPMAKRIQPGVIQNYEGTNAPANIYKINCEGIKPNWTLVIPDDETQANQALQSTNNPDPSKAISGPTPIGTYDPGKYNY